MNSTKKSPVVSESLKVNSTDNISQENSGEGLLPYLLEQKLISDDQLQIVNFELAYKQEPIAGLLTRLGFISEAALRDAMSSTSGQKSVDLSQLLVDAEALEKVPRDIALRYSMLPLAWDKENNTLLLVMADPSDLIAQDKLVQLLPPNTKFEFRLANVSDINKAVDEAYGYKLNIDGILQEIETGKVDMSALESDKAYSQPTVRLVTAIITDAVKRDASDIHFEPEAEFLRVRYRIDGVLRQIRILHKSYWSAMVVRIKVIARLNIAEVRAPQDGRLSMSVRGNPVDFRVSILPTVHGENIVLRILDRKRRELTLGNIGATQSQIKLFEKLMARPEGIIIVTGPTGSGKTTTLYAMLSKINSEAINIMTLEDPVEYPISMIRQTSIGDTIKFDYADGIRSMMRQDPDVILVGEIRDYETAEMSFRASMTGHQVYTTLHTNSVFGVIPRLADMKISPQIISGNIIGVVAQRLVRILCHHCKEEINVPDYLKNKMPSVNHIYKAVGCKECEWTGYKGRSAIFEILAIDDEINLAIAHNKNALEIRDIAKKNGFISLAEDGISRVSQGITSIEEIARNTDLSHFSK